MREELDLKVNGRTLRQLDRLIERTKERPVRRATRVHEELLGVAFAAFEEAEAAVEILEDDGRRGLACAYHVRSEQLYRWLVTNNIKV